MRQKQLLVCAAALAVVAGVALCVLLCNRRDPGAGLPRVEPGAHPAGDERPGAEDRAETVTERSGAHAASDERPSAKDRAQAAARRCRELQQDYWTFDVAEKRRLLERHPERLSWNETLRLLHLSCLELLSTDEGQRQLLATEKGVSTRAPDSSAASLCKALVRRLIADGSPYRPRPAVVLSPSVGQSSVPDMVIEGLFRNASITHLGALEVIRIDGDKEPIEVAFVGLGELRGVTFSNSAMFRTAKLIYDDGRGEETVLVPRLYGVSWGTPNARDHDDSRTRFRCHMKVEGVPAYLGVGIGGQDFTALRPNGRASHFGLSAVAEIVVGLSTDGQRFEQWCKSRELDPGEVRSRVFP